MGLSLAERVAVQGGGGVGVLGGLSGGELEALRFDWGFWGRPEQQLPVPVGSWDFWLLLTGRGWGKTRTGAEAVREWVRLGAGRLALIGATAADVRDTMIEGESGLLSVYSRSDRPKYEPSKRRVTWSNGAVALLYSADEPDRLRGPQQEKLWGDEPAAWRFGKATWDNALLGLRLGESPQAVLTTTPRPIPLIKELVEDERCFVTTGSTHENVQNLAPLFAREILGRYEGTRLGRQEIYAELLLDVPGALWQYDWIEDSRWETRPAGVEFQRVVVAVDPAVTKNESSDETGIVVAAQIAGTDPSEYAVLGDFSGKYTVDGWARKAIDLYWRFEADVLVAEVNQGGDMVESLVRQHDPDRQIKYKDVRATRGKLVRAEPIAGLYEQQRVHHLGRLATLEDQQTTYTHDRQYVESPDRLDALVWALTYMVKQTRRKWSLIG